MVRARRPAVAVRSLDNNFLRGDLILAIAAQGAPTMRPTLLFTILCCCFLCALPAQAQDLDNASINGRVTDQTGALIVDATVTAVLVSTNAARTVKTDGTGRYRLLELAPGAYTV